jgi:AcrR family transcriptional regulator
MSPRTPKQFEDIRNEKKAHIMNVALEHFANEGYHHTTISHIAKHAGISKGLMYNYFASKEELLAAILSRSMGEISHYFDPDRDGLLSPEEFELFIRKYFQFIRDNLSFWRLYCQLLQQKDVREHFLKAFQAPVNSVESIYINGNQTFLALASKLISEYFMRKRENKPAEYDSVLDMNMFIYTIEGFSHLTAFLDAVDAKYYEKTIEKIIELYK